MPLETAALDISESLKKVYSLYTSGEYAQAQELNDQIRTTDPSNRYAARYASLIEKELNTEKKKKAFVQGKELACPSCLSRISLTALTHEQQANIESGNVANLQITCPYCHTDFTLQEQKEKSLLGLKVGSTFVYDQKNYRSVGYVRCDGAWIEYESGSYDSRGKLQYLEWLCLGEDHSFLYLSESQWWYEGKKTVEIEIAKKIVPNFSIQIQDLSVSINDKKLYDYEINEVSVSVVYGEHSKGYTIGEKVKSVSFAHERGKYIAELEGAGSQKEIGVYETKEIPYSQLSAIFGLSVGQIGELKSPVLSVGKYGKSLFSIVVGCVLGAIIFGLFGSAKTLISSQDIVLGKDYYISGEHTTYSHKTTCSSENYSWDCYVYDVREGIAFSVKDGDDKTLIQALIQNPEKIVSPELRDIVGGKLYRYIGDYKRFQFLPSLLIGALLMCVPLIIAIYLIKKQ